MINVFALRALQFRRHESERKTLQPSSQNLGLFDDPSVVITEL